MSAYSDMAERLTTEEGAKQFQRWLKSSVTRDVLTAMREWSKPGVNSIGDMTPDKGMALFAMTAGMNAVLDHIENLDTHAQNRMSELPDPTYGAEAVMETWGMKGKSDAS